MTAEIGVVNRIGHHQTVNAAFTHEMPGAGEAVGVLVLRWGGHAAPLPSFTRR